MADYVLGVIVQAEATERGYFSPSIAAGLLVPLCWDTAVTSIEGTEQGLHNHPWVLCVRAVPESPPCLPSGPAPQTQQAHLHGEAIPSSTAPASGADGGRPPASGTGQSVPSRCKERGYKNKHQTAGMFMTG